MPLISQVHTPPCPYKPLVSVGCFFQIDEYSDADFLRYQIPRPSTLERAVDKRCAEFIAGRYVASQALQKLNPGDADTVVGIGDMRCPIWPTGVIGSISHSNNQAIAVVGSTRDCQAVGVDIEPVMSESTHNEIGSYVLNADESLWVSECNLDPLEWTTAVFALKEAFYKAAFPDVQRMFGFNAISVTQVVGTDWVSGVTITVKLNETLSATYPCNATFPIHLQRLPSQQLMALFYRTRKQAESA